MYNHIGSSQAFGTSTGWGGLVITHMPLLWLRVATVLYGVGLIHAILMLRQRGECSGKIAAPAVGLGMVFHFVSLVETASFYGYAALLTIRHAESALALIIALIFTGLYLRYKTASPAAFIFPLIFMLTFASAISQHSVTISSSSIFGGWILFHVCTLIFGYAMLFLSFVSSLLYLVLSRQLKRKQTSRWAARMPALQEIDELGYKALLLGFPVYDHRAAGWLRGRRGALRRRLCRRSQGAALAVDVGHLSCSSLHALERRLGGAERPPTWPALPSSSRSAPGARIT